MNESEVIQLIEELDALKEGVYRLADFGREELKIILFSLQRYCEEHDGKLEGVLLRTSSGIIEVSVRLGQLEFDSRDEYLKFLRTVAYAKTVSVAYIDDDVMKSTVLLDGLCERIVNDEAKV